VYIKLIADFTLHPKLADQCVKIYHELIVFNPPDFKTFFHKSLHSINADHYFTFSSFI